MISTTENGPPLSDDDIVALERQLGVSLPSSYRQFLLKNNGGRPEPDIIHIEGLGGGSTDIQVFFRVNGCVESSNILSNWESCSGRIPDQFLPIGCDSLGSVFCICLSGVSRGAVVFCLLTFDEDDGTIYFVANSFDEFLDRIVPFESLRTLN